MTEALSCLCVQPGSSWSTSDVYTGLVAALRAQGHTVHQYLLDRRLARTVDWMSHNWKKTVEANLKRLAAEQSPDRLRCIKRQARAGRLSYLPRPPTAGAAQYWAGAQSIEMALRLDVPWVLVVSGMYFHPDLLIMLRRAGRKVALLCTESPYDSEQEASRLPFVDVVFTNERTTAEEWRTVHPRVTYLPHAYDPARHHPEPSDLDAEVPAHDVVFVGTDFAERVELLEAVNWDGIDLGLYGQWKSLRRRSPLRRFVTPGTVPNAVAAALYRKAKIGLNLYRTSIGYGPRAARIPYAESLNPRAYELAACGAFSISSYRREVAARFGELVPTFRDAPELEARIRHYLAQEDERLRLASQLADAVRGCTFAERAATVADALSPPSAGASGDLAAVGASGTT